MAFWLDAQTGELTKEKLEAHLKADPNLTVDSEDSSGLTPLAYAILSGNSKVVKLLLDNGASPDKKIGDKRGPKDGRTPMYLAATANSQRARNVQLLLDKNPTSFDEAIPTRGGRTPLMAAISQTKDPQVVKLLVQSGASPEKKDSKGQTALDLAGQLRPARSDIKKALQITPIKGRGGLDTFIQWVLAVLSFFNIWGPLSAIFDAAIRLFYKVASPVGVPPGEDVEEPRTVAEFKNNLDNAVRDGGLERFFPPGDPYVQQVAEKAASLKDDPSNLLNTPRQISCLATLALYQPVLYCDDSESMNKEGRWDKQKQLVERITNITNRAVPKRTGVHLRVINRDLPSADNLDGAAVAQKLAAFAPRGGTPLGTQLRRRVLEPLVYSALNHNDNDNGNDEGKALERPYLVLVTTDGCPWLEDEDAFRGAVLECARALAGAGYRKDAVRFCLSQIGTDPEAKEFMVSLDMDWEVLEVLHRTSEVIDSRFNELADNEKNLEAWKGDIAQASELPDHSTPSSTENNTLESNILRRKWLTKNRGYAQLLRASGKLFQTEKDPRDGEHLQGKNCKGETAELDKRIEEAKARKPLEAVEENPPRICSTRRESHNEVIRQSRIKKRAEPKDPWLSRNKRNRMVAKRRELGLGRNCGTEPRDGRTAMGKIRKAKHAESLRTQRQRVRALDHASDVLKDLDDGRMTSNAVPEDDQPNHQPPEALLVAESSTSNSFSLPVRPRNTFWDVVV
ncbi:hypothetical protein F4809DRAFT_657658 [Biscogniauxia mediterranea]|nr:hypothetical protein F4809DRAFT_657658 [Biscogniauxia mediterranea]